MAVARLTLARQCYTCFKNIYFVGNILLHSVTMGIFAADSKCLVMHAQCFPSYQLAYSPLLKQLACNLFVCLFVHLLSHTCNIGHVNYKLQFICYNINYNIWTSTQYNIINNNTKFKDLLEVESVTTNRNMCIYILIPGS